MWSFCWLLVYLCWKMNGGGGAGIICITFTLIQNFSNSVGCPLVQLYCTLALASYRQQARLLVKIRASSWRVKIVNTVKYGRPRVDYFVSTIDICRLVAYSEFSQPEWWPLSSGYRGQVIDDSWCLWCLGGMVPGSYRPSSVGLHDLGVK